MALPTHWGKEEDGALCLNQPDWTQCQSLWLNTDRLISSRENLGLERASLPQEGATQ